MRRFAFLLWFLTLAAGCIVEDKPINPSGDGGVDAGVDAGELCGTVSCPADRPLCSDALECVQCTANDDSYCTEQGLLCDVASSNCIACAGDADCTDPMKSHCDMNVCVPCTEQGHCEGIEGIGDGESACNDGDCVDCTPETERNTCVDGTACNPATNQCTTVRIGSLDVCEECVADSQCGEDGAASDAHRCVPMFYEMVDDRFPNADTGFCLKSTDGGCVQPFSVTLTNRESLSGAPAADYCGVREQLATCPAVKALADGLQCPTGDPRQCPQPSGLCEQVGDLPNRCTYLCGAVQQCLDIGPDPDNPNTGSTCDSSGTGGTGGVGGAGGKYCGG